MVCAFAPTFQYTSWRPPLPPVNGPASRFDIYPIELRSDAVTWRIQAMPTGVFATRVPASLNAQALHLKPGPIDLRTTIPLYLSQARSAAVTNIMPHFLSQSGRLVTSLSIDYSHANSIRYADPGLQGIKPHRHDFIPNVNPLPATFNASTPVQSTIYT